MWPMFFRYRGQLQQHAIVEWNLRYVLVERERGSSTRYDRLIFIEAVRNGIIELLGFHGARKPVSSATRSKYILALHTNAELVTRNQEWEKEIGLWLVQRKQRQDLKDAKVVLAALRKHLRASHSRIRASIPEATSSV